MRRCCPTCSQRSKAPSARRGCSRRSRRRASNRACRRIFRRTSRTTFRKGPVSTCSAARAARCSMSARAATCAAACSITFRRGTGPPRKRSSGTQVREVEWIETGGELGALLLESRMVKELAPTANRRLRKSAGVFCVRLHESDGALQPCVEALDAEFLDGDAEAYGPFRSERDARRALEGKAREAGLCLKLLGLEQGSGSCFAFQLGRCRGACVGKEPPALHDARLRLALASLRLRAWPFEGPVGIRERAVDGAGTLLHVVDRWQHLGTAQDEGEVAELLRAAMRSFVRSGQLPDRGALPRAPAAPRPRDVRTRRALIDDRRTRSRGIRILRRLPAARIRTARGGTSRGGPQRHARTPRRRQLQRAAAGRLHRMPALAYREPGIARAGNRAARHRRGDARCAARDPVGGTPRAPGHARGRRRGRGSRVAAAHAVRGAENQGRDRGPVSRAHGRAAFGGLADT